MAGRMLAGTVKKLFTAFACFNHAKTTVVLNFKTFFSLSWQFLCLWYYLGLFFKKGMFFSKFSKCRPGFSHASKTRFRNVGERPVTTWRNVVRISTSSSESTVGWSSLCKLPTGPNPPTAYCFPCVIFDDGCINKRIVRPEKPFDPKYSPKKCDWSSGQRWRLRWRHLIDRKVWRMLKVAFHCCGEEYTLVSGRKNLLVY